MKSLISVLIPAYNHENYVQEAIQSIIDQTHENIELIIINDGSSDSTLDKINEMKEQCEKRFTRFVLQTQENQGTCITLNKLLELAQGEYVYLMASDDRAMPDGLEILGNFLSNHPDYALAVGENLFMDKFGKQCYWGANRNIVYNLEEIFYTSFSDFLSKVLNINLQSEKFGSYSTLLFCNHVPNGQLIRRSIFEKTGPYTPEAPLEDYYLNLQISKYAKMKHLPKPLFYYRWHDSNTISQKEKADEMAKKTILYEYSSVIQSGNAPLIQVLQAHLDIKLKMQQAQAAQAAQAIK